MIKFTRNLAILIVSIGSPIVFHAQANDWELPIKNDMICFEYNKEFKNKKKELCLYYTGLLFKPELQTKIQAELSGKGGKLLSNTNYTMVFTLLGADFNLSDPKTIKSSYCDSKMNDTLEGTLQIFTQKSEIKLTHLKNSANKVSCRFKIIFTGSSQYYIKFRGFTLSGMKSNLMKGGAAQSTEEYLEDVYKEFLNEKRKNKSEIAFYKDLKEMVGIFERLLGEQLEREIKLAELD